MSTRSLASEMGRSQSFVSRAARVWKEYGQKWLQIRSQKHNSPGQKGETGGESYRTHQTFMGYHNLLGTVTNTKEREAVVTKATTAGKSVATAAVAWKRRVKEGPLTVPKAQTQQGFALDALIEAAEQDDGLTADQVKEITGINHQSIGRVMTNLVDAGWITVTGMWRETRSGRRALIHFLTADGAKQVGLTGYDFKKVSTSRGTYTEPKTEPKTETTRGTSRSQPRGSIRNTTPTFRKPSAKQAEEEQERALVRQYRDKLYGVEKDFARADISLVSMIDEIDNGSVQFSIWRLRIAIKNLSDFATAWESRTN
jgi:hypothetical protein